MSTSYFTDTTLDFNGHMPSSSGVKPPTPNYPMSLNKRHYIKIGQRSTNYVFGENIFLPLLLFIAQLECILHNSITNKFQPLLEDAILGSLKPFHPTGPSSPYQPPSHKGHCTPSLHKINSFDTILMYFQSHEPSFFLDFEINFISSKKNTRE